MSTTNNYINFQEFESSIRRIASMDIEINCKYDQNYGSLIEHASNQNIKSYLEQRKKFAQMYVSSSDDSLKENIMINIQNINSIISNYIGLGFVGQKTLFDEPYFPFYTYEAVHEYKTIMNNKDSFDELKELMQEPIDFDKIENK